MAAAYLKIVTRFLLSTAFIFAITGCGSSGSSSSTVDNSTGSIAAKLVWSTPLAKTTTKTLYAAPIGVKTIKIFVYDANMISLIPPKDFTVTSGVNGSGTIDGIPVGTGYTVKAWGLDSSGVLLYEGLSTADVAIGSPTVVPIAMAPITTANPRGETYPMPFDLTLTSSVPATIYYTTNGSDPTSSSSIRGTGSNQVIFSIYSSPTTVKFFSIDAGSAQEATKTKTYSKP